MKQRLVLLPLAVLLLFLSPACDSLPKRGTDEATVSIGQPTVYMRERSLIERFEDLEWLRLQRDPGKEKEYEQGFQGSATTATAEKTGFALKAAIGKVLAEKESQPAPPPLDSTPVEVAGPPATAPGTAGTAATTSETPPADGSTPAGDATDGAKEGEKKEEKSSDLDTFLKLDELSNAALGAAFAELNAAEPTLSPRDKLVNRLAFRDTVAEAIRQRSLDDVHDLEGMALYEIQFDLSIVGGANPGQSYAVMLEVVPPKELPTLDRVEAERVIEALKAECLAEIEETTALLEAGDLTVRDSGPVPEAALRGMLAARHEDMQRVVEAMRSVEREQIAMAQRLSEAAQEIAAALPPGGDEPLQRRLASLKGLVLDPVTPTWIESLRTFGSESMSLPKVRDRIVFSKDLGSLHPELWRMSEASDENLRSFAQRQDLLVEMEAELRAIRSEVETRRQSLADELSALRLRLEIKGKDGSRQEAQDAQSEVSAAEFAQTTLQALDLERVIEAVGSMEARQGDFPLRTVTSIGAYDPLYAGSVRTAEDDRTFQDILRDMSKLRALGESTSLQVQELLRIPSPNAAKEYTVRALGFAIARSHARTSSGVLEVDESIDVNGMDAKTLLPLFLRGKGGWNDIPKLLPLSAPRVVSVTPTEVAEQLTTSAFSDIGKAFSLALEGTFRGTVAEADAAYDRVSRELRRYELIGRNALLVGFVGGDVPTDCRTPREFRKGANSFGWVLGPRLETSTEGQATLRYRQAATHHPVTATLVAPAMLGELELRYRVFRISDEGEWFESRTFPQPHERVRTRAFPQGTRPAIRSPHSITLALPKSPETIAQGLITRSRWGASAPKILALPTKESRWRLRAGKEKQGLAILGSNLWRNPQVYVGGQRATRVQILPDLGGLFAEFEGVQAPPGQDGKPERVDLVVSTSRGSDRIQGGVEILPLKAEAKPPEPKLVPPLQVVVPKISKGGDVEESKATVDLRFALTPPLPKAWSELQIRVRQKQAAAVLLETKVEPSWLFADPEVPGGFQIRGLEITKKTAWGKIERLEVTLQLRESPVADLRSLHPTPVEVVLVRQPIACTSDQKLVVEKRESDGKWLLAAETTVVLKQEEPLEPALLALLAPKLEVGKLVPAQATIEGQGTAKAQLRAEREAVGKLWSAVLPAGVVLSAPDKPNIAVKLEIGLEEGAPKLAVSLQLEPKEDKEEKPKEEEKKKDK